MYMHTHTGYQHLELFCKTSPHSHKGIRIQLPANQIPGICLLFSVGTTCRTVLFLFRPLKLILLCFFFSWLKTKAYFEYFSVTSKFKVPARLSPTSMACLLTLLPSEKSSGQGEASGTLGHLWQVAGPLSWPGEICVLGGTSWYFFVCADGSRGAWLPLCGLGTWP